MTVLTDEDLIDIFSKQLPRILEERPDLEPHLYYWLMKAFVRKEEVAAFERRMTEYQVETKANFDNVKQQFKQVDERFDKVDERFDKVDERFDKVDERFDKIDSRFEQVDDEFSKVRTEMSKGFKALSRQIDQLGSRWGIRNEALFRATITSVLEKSFGATVETRDIKGEQFDLVISNGRHILIEIAASVRHNIRERLERKRQLYTQETGVEPDRVILAVVAIHSRLAQVLQEAGIEVIEPEDDNLLDE